MLLRFSPHLLKRFTLSLLSIVMLGNYTLAQYPSTGTLISDVKASDPKAFVTVTPKGDWKMTHDKAPEWKDPDACEHVVLISGNKKADGTYWSYKGFVIYNKVGGKMVFNRVFLDEDETRLNGVNLPDDAFFIHTFKEKLNAMDVSLLKTNPGIRDATNFYSVELKTKPRATGNSEQIVAYATVSIVYDSYFGSGYKLQKRKSDIELKFEKVGTDFVYKFGMRKGDYQLLEEKDYGSKEILKTIPIFSTSGKTYDEWTSQNTTYPEPLGSNGEGYPKDQELIPMIESTFLTKEDNFIVLFGAKAGDMITEVKFKVKDDEKAVKEGSDKMNKAFYVDYIFFNAKEEEKKLTEITGRRVLEIQLQKTGGEWGIVGAKFITETEYIKKTPLNWSSYINTVRANTFNKRVFGK